MKNETIYQSILSQLSLVPVDYLQQIDVYLRNLSKEIRRKEHNRSLVLSLAGAWNDMPETDFQDFLITSKKMGNEIFNRQIEL